MNILLRLEEEKDYRATEIVTRDAFYNVQVSGCEEHDSHCNSIMR